MAIVTTMISFELPIDSLHYWGTGRSCLLFTFNLSPNPTTLIIFAYDLTFYLLLEAVTLCYKINVK